MDGKLYVLLNNGELWHCNFIKGKKTIVADHVKDFGFSKYSPKGKWWVAKNTLYLLNQNNQLVDCDGKVLLEGINKVANSEIACWDNSIAVSDDKVYLLKGRKIKQLCELN